MNFQQPMLVATDLRPGYEATLAEAGRLALALDVELTLLHAVRKGATGEAEARCRALGAALVEGGCRVTPDPVVSVAPFEQLVFSTLKARATSLVVVGAGKKEGLERILLGSSVETLLRDCSRPLWIVHPENSPKISRVMVAVDTSRVAGEALRVAAMLARSFGARLDLLRVFPEGASRATSYKGQQEKLRTYAAGFDLDGFKVEYVTWEGEPGKRIVEAASSRRSHLLVLGAAGRRGVARWLKLPLGEQVIRQLPCSLLSVPLGPVLP